MIEGGIACWLVVSPCHSPLVGSMCSFVRSFVTKDVVNGVNVLSKDAASSSGREKGVEEGSGVPDAVILVVDAMDTGCLTDLTAALASIDAAACLLGRLVVLLVQPIQREDHAVPGTASHVAEMLAAVGPEGATTAQGRAARGRRPRLARKGLVDDVRAAAIRRADVKRVLAAPQVLGSAAACVNVLSVGFAQKKERRLVLDALSMVYTGTIVPDADKQAGVPARHRKEGRRRDNVTSSLVARCVAQLQGKRLENGIAQGGEVEGAPQWVVRDTCRAFLVVRDALTAIRVSVGQRSPECGSGRSGVHASGVADAMVGRVVLC